jgi:hypothetical protein
MRIIPYDNDVELEDIESLSIIIKAVPFEGGYVPAFFIQSPGEEYPMSLDEVNCLMDGVEIAKRSVDQIIDFILKHNLDSDD